MSSSGGPSSKRARDDDKADPVEEAKNQLAKNDANQYHELILENRWVVQTLRTAFNKIKGVVSDLGLGSVDHLVIDTVPQYAFKFQQLANAMEAKMKEPLKDSIV